MESRRIFIIDDNQSLRRYLGHMLEQKGHTTATAENGLNALDMLADYQPDVIFLDLVLPDIGGDMMCRILRQMSHLAGCYIVILSAAVAEAGIKPSDIGANEFIAKGPFGKMTDHVLEALERSRATDLSKPKETVTGVEDVYIRLITKELLLKVEHLEAFLESIDESLIEIRTGRIVYANEAAVRLFGTEAERMIGKRPHVLFADLADRRVADLFESETNDSISVGVRRPVEFRDRLLVIKKLPVRGRRPAELILIDDVTERRRLELQLQHAQKMETIGTIAGGVAHSFRNTLAGILMNTQLIKADSGDQRKLSELLDRIGKGVSDGAQLVDRLMPLAHKQNRSAFKNIDITALISETLEIIRKSFDQRIEIETHLPDSLIVVGDSNGLFQVLMNLCTNARDAMPDGGVLAITARRKGSEAVITVSDTGVGMDPGTISNCFDPFFTTKEPDKGTGLGLSTTYGIVEGHNGAISVTSVPGKGAIFTFRLPLATGPVANGDGQPVNPLRKGCGEKVLVVDDDENIIKAMPELLAGLGYIPLVADNAEDGVEQYRRHRPDAVLLDLDMPEIDGVGCARKIIEIDPGARIAIISGYHRFNAGGPRGGAYGFIHGYLNKPFDIRQLSELLDSLLSRSRPRE